MRHEISMNYFYGLKFHEFLPHMTGIHPIGGIRPADE
jgi:hypothetical protein